MRAKLLIEHDEVENWVNDQLIELSDRLGRWCLLECEIMLNEIIWTIYEQSSGRMVGNFVLSYPGWNNLPQRKHPDHPGDRRAYGVISQVPITKGIHPPEIKAAPIEIHIETKALHPGRPRTNAAMSYVFNGGNLVVAMARFEEMLLRTIA